MKELVPFSQFVKIKKRKSFLLAHHNGRKFFVRGFVLNVVKSPVNQTRIGFTTTKKLGNAVRRNRIRRKLKEAARLVLPYKAEPGYDYIIIGRHAAFERHTNLLQDDMHTVMGLFRESYELDKCCCRGARKKMALLSDDKSDSLPSIDLQEKSNADT